MYFYSSTFQNAFNFHLMKNRLTFYLLFIGLFLAIFQFSCDHEERRTTDHPEIEEDKRKPNDWLYRQRAYPTGKIEVSMYPKAAQYRKKMLKQQTTSQNASFKNNAWQFSGPTNIGGRVTAIEMTTTNPKTIYVGAASGGIFKSDDMGTNWLPIFDQQGSLTIGDLALAPSNQNIIYVGTGEANGSGNSITYTSNGVYRSDDAGATWNHLGLDSVGSVGKVIVHPTNPNTCWISATGYLFEKNTARGVYKTTDGGSTWQQVFFMNDSTGVIDMVIDPTDPNTLYMATWERIRYYYKRHFGGPSSGVFKSTDGGITWTRQTNGLPSSAGRIGLSIAPTNPQILYATIEDEVTKGLKGLYKTTDGGVSWNTISTNGVNSVPYMWWFGKIEVDPTDANTVYLPAFETHKSTNGGNSWNDVFAGAHVDQHAIYIDPQNPNFVILGNDGGIYFSSNGGNSYVKSDNLPITQFYTCEIDEQFPERLYGGTQDNSSMRTTTGNVNDWEIIYYGDGFVCMVDPSDNKYVYTEYQNGNFAKSIDYGSPFSFNGATSGISNGDRKNWNTPVIFHPSDPTILFYGSNRLYKSTNRANFWNAISGDLTTNPQGTTLTFGTITTISVSPIDDNVIYVGTDDGNVQITTDGGSNWNLISGNLPTRWVSTVLADPANINTAYVTLSGYRYSSNTGSIYKTTDQGATWTDITNNLIVLPVSDLLKTPNGNLYLANDVGVFYSENEGATWNILGTDLPNLIVMDLDYHAGENKLVAATYGRGMYSISLDVSTPITESDNTKLMSSVFPNPFIDATTLALAIEKAGRYTVQLVDVNGRLLKTVYSGELMIGKQEVPVSGDGLAAGIYFLRVLVDGKPIGKGSRLVKND